MPMQVPARSLPPRGALRQPPRFSFLSPRLPSEDTVEISLLFATTTPPRYRIELRHRRMFPNLCSIHSLVVVGATRL